jgi:hypothetical protein
LAKYVVILVVVLCAAHLLLSRRKASSHKTAAGRSLHRTLESTVRKAAIAAGVLIAALAVILLVKHVTS